MKKVYLIIAILVLMVNIQAQETTTIEAIDQQTETSYFGFGGPMVSATLLNQDLGFTIGGKGGAIFNETLAFGGLGFGTVNSPGFTGDNLTGNTSAPLEMSYGAGGVFFEYIFNFGDRIQFSIPLNLMAGGVSVYESSTETEVESTALFIIEPGINIDLNISDNYTQSFFISYRQVIGSSLINLNDSHISGLNVGLLFKFGAK